MPTTGVERGLIATLLVGAIFLVVHHSGRIGGPARIITVSVGEEEPAQFGFSAFSMPDGQKAEMPVADNTAEVPFTPVENVCDLPEFGAGGPQLNISIFVFAWRRLASLRRLMESLQTAEYCGHTMPLHVWVDAGASEPVASYVASLEWPHGSLQVTDFGAMGQSMGIRGMWTNVTALGDHHHVLPLEDDIEVSPLYYWWLLFAAARWGPFGDAELALRTRRMVGVSLYTPRLNEIAYPQAKWLPEAHTTGAAFLLQVPCSWGALFFGSAWREFIAFYRMRVRPPFFNFTQEATQVRRAQFWPNSGAIPAQFWRNSAQLFRPATSLPYDAARPRRRATS